MKENSVKTNYIYNTISQLLSIIIPFVTTPYISRILGVDNIGIYSYANAIVTYFVVFATFGSATFGQRNVAFNKDNKNELNNVFWDIFSFRVISGIVAIMLYIVLLIAMQKIELLYIIFIINILNVVLDVSWFFQGISLFKQLVLRNILIKLISLISIFVFIKSSNDLIKYVLIVCLSTLIGNISMWGILKKYILLPKKIQPFKEFKEMGMIFLPTIAIQVYAVLDKSMIGIISDSTYANGCYEQAEKIARVALTIVTSIGTVVLSKVANLYKKNKLEEAKNYVYLSYRFVWFLAIPITFGIIGIAPIFIPIFLGSGYESAVILLQIFSTLVVFVSLSYVTGNAYLIPTKQQNIYTVSVSCAAICNFILNLILIPKYSATGAAISSCIVECLGCFIQIIYCCITKQLKIKKIFNGFGKAIISGVVMLIFLLYIKNGVEVNILSLILSVILGGLIYMCVLLIMRDEFFIYLINSGKEFFIKRKNEK